jgi:hypothetical protein
MHCCAWAKERKRARKKGHVELSMLSTAVQKSKMAAYDKWCPCILFTTTFFGKSLLEEDRINKINFSTWDRPL